MTSETQRGTPYGEPFTLTCFRQSPINPVHCNPVHRRQSYATVTHCWPHSDRHPQPFTRQDLGYAQRERLARTLFWQESFLSIVECVPALERGVDIRRNRGRPHSSEAAFTLMASHWPPERLPGKGKPTSRLRATPSIGRSFLQAEEFKLHTPDAIQGAGQFIELQFYCQTRTALLLHLEVLVPKKLLRNRRLPPKFSIFWKIAPSLVV